MIIEIANNDVNYATYGDIDTSIHIKRMLWDEGEEVKFNEQLLPNLMEFTNERKIFLFLKRGENYPVSLIGKKLGMWYAIWKKYNQQFTNTIEKKIELNRYCEIGRAHV